MIERDRSGGRVAFASFVSSKRIGADRCVVAALVLLSRV
jgi:hypothetical protein